MGVWDKFNHEWDYEIIHYQYGNFILLNYHKFVCEEITAALSEVGEVFITINFDLVTSTLFLRSLAECKLRSQIIKQDKLIYCKSSKGTMTMNTRPQKLAHVNCFLCSKRLKWIKGHSNFEFVCEMHAFACHYFWWRFKEGVILGPGRRRF